MNWLFDDKEAWEKTIRDPKWSYDLPLAAFMEIYQKYRNTSHAKT